ncbi:MAG: TolC family protein [Candidatus Eisenbacteria bacterium]
MTSPRHAITCMVILAALAAAGHAAADVLTVDDAVRIALQNSPSLKNAGANVMDAHGAVQSAYSGMLPHVSASVTRFGQNVSNQTGGQKIGGVITNTPIGYDFESHGTTPTLTGSWNVLDLSAIGGVSSAKKSAHSSELTLQATRNDVVYGTKQQFYEVVKAIRLSSVSDSALRLARDNERRVRALFEVGSVSKSDLLVAQVATANAQLDSLTQSQNVINQRITLSELLGIKESEMPGVDANLDVAPTSYDEATLFAEASKARPDLRASDAELAAARAGVGAARWSYLPFLSLGGSYTYQPTSTSTSTANIAGQPSQVNGTKNETDYETSGSIALNWDLFDGLAREGRNQAAKARLVRAQESRDALYRNLQSEVHQVVLLHQAVVVGEEVAHRSLDSAEESMKLNQEKYNVGSATILDLINAQVSYQRAAASLVSARAAIKVAEARIDQLRGLAY